MNDLSWETQRKILNSIPEDVRRKIHENGQNEAEKLFKEFNDAFSNGICDSCGKSIKSFSVNSPCFHWLLRPGKTKKEHIKTVLSRRGYFRCAAYIRWVANYESHFKNINNLSEEGNKEALFHWSAKYKHIKWTFWCTHNDYAGYDNQPPHFHFSMHLDKGLFIKFNDFHIPFTDEDLFNIRCNEDPDSPVKQTFGFHGAGLEELFSGDAEKIFDNLTTTDHEDEAIYHIQTSIQFEEDMPEDIVNEAFKKAKEMKVPVARIFKELGYDARVTIAPAESLIEKENRNNPRKKKRD